MQLTAEHFDSLRSDDYFWYGPLPTEWLGVKTDFMIYKDEFTYHDHHALSTDTREYVGVVANLTSNAFTALETFLFCHYQNSIYLKLYDDCEYAPRISTPSEIWTIVSKPTIKIPCLSTRVLRKVGFYALFECSWDPEHGFAVEHDSDYAPTLVIDIDQCWS